MAKHRHNSTHRSRHDPWERSPFHHEGKPFAHLYPDRAGRYVATPVTAELLALGPTFVRCDVQFTDSIGRTDDLAKAMALKELGFEVRDTLIASVSVTTEVIGSGEAGGQAAQEGQRATEGQTDVCSDG